MAEKKPAEKPEENLAEKEMRVLTAQKTVRLSTGKKLDIRPYSWADTFHLAKPFSIVLGAIATHFPEMQEALQQMDGKSQFEQVQEMATFLGSLKEGDAVVDALTDMAALAVHGRPEEIRTMMLDDFLTLASAIFEVNKDFFVQRLAPKLPKAMTKPAK